MSISGVSATSSNAALLQLLQQRSRDLTTLESAVQSGNMTTAQQSLTTLQQDNETLGSMLDPSSNQSADNQPTGSSGQSAFVSDLTGLLQAVQSGDMATAQQDAAAVQNDLQDAGSQQAPAATSGPHHHHRHHMDESAGTTSDQSSTTTTDASATSSTDAATGTSSNNLLALIQALYDSNS